MHHKAVGRGHIEPEVVERDEAYKEKLRKSAAKIKDWLKNNDDRTGRGGKPVKSNITDNESAKMATSKGVIQGYVGVASVDKKHQVIVSAEAYGQGSESDLFVPAVEAVRSNFEQIGDTEVLGKVKVVADTRFRKGDPRFITADRYKDLPRFHFTSRAKHKRLFRPADFAFADDLSYAICPAGKRLYRSGSNVRGKNYLAYKLKGTKRDCLKCHLRREYQRKLRSDNVPIPQGSLVLDRKGSRKR